jgi:hypothetical protein
MNERETIERTLNKAKSVLAVLEEQAAGYTYLTIPAHLKVELDQKRQEVATLEAQLNQLQNSGVTAQREIKPNPFGDTGRITDPHRFFGREELLRQLFEELAKGSNRVLVGADKVGKSSILSMVCQLGPERLRLPQDAFISLDMRNVDDEQDFFEALCHKLKIQPPCRGNKFARALGGKRYILCIDEIHLMTNEADFTGKERTQLCGLADGADTPLTLVIASQKPLIDLFPDSPYTTSPLAGICQQIDVKPFSSDEARRFLVYRLEGTGVSFSEDEIQELLQQSNGNPGRLQIKAAELYHRLTYFAG